VIWYQRFKWLILYSKAFLLTFVFIVQLGSGEDPIVASAYVIPMVFGMIVADAGWARGNGS
jgi:hypothetical protein